MEFLANWALFSAKSLTLLAFVLVFLFLTTKAKLKARAGELCIKSLDKQLKEQQLSLMQQILGKKELKQKLKLFKKNFGKDKKADLEKNRIFVLDFKGNLPADEAKNLAEEVTAVLQIADKNDEVFVRIESPGGAVSGYGYAASQLKRIRDRHIKLTVAVDKVAASGGYLMACVADQIVAAPFAIIGSIGVVAQIPNFHRFLDKHNVDFEQIYAGKYKRTLTLFGKNTEAGRKKMEEQLEEIHDIFQSFIKEHRPQVDLEKVATGEFWLAKDALKLELVDRLETSDDYLLSAFNEKRELFEVKFIQKKSFKAKFSNSMKAVLEKLNANAMPF